MKRFGFISTAFLLVVLLGTTCFGYAQHDQAGEQHGKPEKQAKPEKQNKKPQQQGLDKHQEKQGKRPERAQQQQQQVRNSQQQQQRVQQQQQVRNNHEQRVQQQRPERVQRTQLQRTHEQQRSQENEQRGAWQQHRAHGWESEHRTWQQRGGYNGYRIPDSYFRDHYGRNHWFRVYSLPFMQVGGYPRFQYGGYWFSPVDPYPEYWADNWYQSDDVYVDYVENGYYLYNRSYPNRPGIAINISF